VSVSGSSPKPEPAFARKATTCADWHRPTAPDIALYRATRARRDTTVARLTVARKIGKRLRRKPRAPR
jgi:hypothetical protein